MVIVSLLEGVEAASLSKDSEFDQDPKTVWKKSKRLLTFATASNYRANVDVLVEAEAEAHPDTLAQDTQVNIKIYKYLS